jgi:hypothetical protein
MPRQFEIVFEKREVIVTADLLEAAAPLTCEAFWGGIQGGWREKAHHGRETGPELWCFVSPLKEDLPYENSTVFPDPGDILFYHYVQPPTRDGKWIFDIGIYYGRGCSKLRQGWIPGNLFARIAAPEDIRKLEAIAGELLTVRELDLILRRKER